VLGGGIRYDENGNPYFWNPIVRDYYIDEQAPQGWGFVGSSVVAGAVDALTSPVFSVLSLAARGNAEKNARDIQAFENRLGYVDPWIKTVSSIGLGLLGGSAANLLKGANLAKGGTVAAGAGLRFSQTTASAAFSAKGTFAGETVGSLAEKVRTGAISPADVPVGYVTIDGNNLIVNTRSSLALMRADIPQSSWTLIDR
jgi:hypothetical protein